MSDLGQQPTRVMLEELLKDMDIPLGRHTITPSNLKWLNKNLHVHNKNNPEFEKTILLVRSLL